MDFSQFGELIDGLEDSMRPGKLLTSPQRERLWKKLSFIPVSGSEKIHDFITRECERMPLNVEKWIKAGWRDFQAANQNKASGQGGSKCEYCGKSGLLHGKSIKPAAIGYRISCVWRCGHCNNWIGKFGEWVAQSTVFKIEQSGFLLDDSSNRDSDGRLKHLVAAGGTGAGRRKVPPDYVPPDKYPGREYGAPADVPPF